jgi:hypothetical protein
MDRGQARLEHSKEMFVQALSNIPPRPAKRNRPLKNLVNYYRKDLEHCDDEIPCNLERFGFRHTMTFSDFIYEVTWGQSR